MKKNLLKSLLVCGFAVSLLAGCGKSNSSKESSGSGSDCPTPEPEVKEAWTPAEAMVFEENAILEIPMDKDLSIVGVQDGVVFAESKAEVTEDDIDAYADLLEEVDDGAFIEYEFNSDPSDDLEYLGFDTDYQFYQYIRQIDENEYNYHNLVTVGMNEDGFMLVAAATVFTPLYVSWDTIIGCGHGYPLLYDSSSREVNLLEGSIDLSFQSSLYATYGAPVNFPVLLDEQVALPEITKEETYGFTFNLAYQYPYFFCNPKSALFGEQEFLIVFTNFTEEGEETEETGYAKSEFDALLTEVQGEPVQGEENTFLIKNEAYEFEVAYDFTVIDESTQRGEIGVHYTVKSFELPNSIAGIVGEIGTAIDSSSEFEDSEEYGYCSDSYLEVASIDEAMAITEAAFLSLGYGALEWHAYGQGGIAYYAEVELFSQDEKDAYILTVLAVDQYIASYGIAIVEIQGEHISSAEYAASLYSDTLGEEGCLSLFLDMGIVDEESNPEMFGLFYGIVSSLLVGLVDEDATFSSILSSYNNMKVLINTYFGSAIVAAAESFAAFIESIDKDDVNYDGTELNNAKKGLADLKTAITEAKSSKDYFTLLEDLAALYYKVNGLFTYAEKLTNYIQALINSGLYSPTAIAQLEQIQADGIAAIDAATKRRDKSDALKAAEKLADEVNPFSVELPAAIVAHVEALDSTLYSEENWAYITTIASNGTQLITESCKTYAQGKQVYDAVIEAIDSVKTIKQTYLAALQSYLATFNEEDYSSTNWAAVQQAYNDGVAAINATSTEQEAQDACVAAITAMAAIKTLAQELADKKAELIATLDSYMETKTEDKYTEENWELLQKAYNDGVAAINAATTIAEAEEAFNTADAAIAAVPQIPAA